MSALNTSIGVSLILTGAVALVAQAPPPGQLPTFRSGIDVVELDVTVLDKDRRPVKGLTAADFSILERGKPQPIVAFAAIDVPAAPPAAAPWIREAPLDVVTNDSENRRLVTIVMDDAYSNFDPDVTKRAKRIGFNAIDQLGPHDLAAVIFTFQGRAQNFTADREKLRAAVDSFLPKSTARDGPPIPCMTKLNSCDVRALSTAASTLLAAPPGRKIAILIGGGRAFSFGEMGDPTSRNEGPELLAMFRDLQRANITVYAFDAHGLLVGGMSAEHRTPQRVSVPPNDSLYSFAESTGGRAIANSNTPESLIGVAFQESSSYYLVGFQSSYTASDGRFHKIDVKVNRAGVEVRTRNGYYAPSKKPAAAGTLINGLPGGDLRIDATAAAFAVPNRAEAEVIIVGHLAPARDVKETRKVNLTATGIDFDGRTHGTQRQGIDITGRPGSRGPDLSSHLPLRPGRYMVRLAADSEGQSGSVYIDVDVPNFAKAPLSMSGLLVERRPAPPVPDKAIAALIPVSPTTQRSFMSTDDVSAYAKVYQGGKGRLLPVKMSAKITNARNEAVSRQELVLEPEQFGAARAADYRVRLPLADLGAGDYLFEVEAKSGAPLERRTVRFSIGGGL
jgi:VWFA-related protein